MIWKTLGDLFCLNIRIPLNVPKVVLRCISSKDLGYIFLQGRGPRLHNKEFKKYWELEF